MGRKKTIAEQVRAEIKSQGLSCYRIAKETGAHESSIGRFVNGRTDLSMPVLDMVCKYLGLELVRSGELLELRKMKKADR